MVNRNNVNILGFDLGSIYGWNYSSYVNNNKLIIKNGGTVDINNAIKNPKWNNVVSDKRKKILVFEEQIKALLENLEIDIVVAEDVFFNPSRPKAYQSLLLYMETLERLVFGLKFQSVFRITPTQIKYAITGNGHSSKEEIQAELFKKGDIEFKKQSLLTNMSSHLSDSICLSYTFSKSLFCLF